MGRLSVSLLKLKSIVVFLSSLFHVQISLIRNKHSIKAWGKVKPCQHLEAQLDFLAVGRILPVHGVLQSYLPALAHLNHCTLELQICIRPRGGCIYV